MARLVEKGYETPAAFGRGGPMFSLHEGARTVERWLCREMPPDRAAQVEILAGDIAHRVAWAEAMIAWLSSSQGPGADEIDPGLRWNDFWRVHGDDPELIALDEARTEALDRVSDCRSDVRDEAYRLSEGAYLVHFRKLLEGHKSTLSIAQLPKLARRGRDLAAAKDEGALLARYRTLDMKLRVYEETLGDLAIGWDRHVEEESDRMRGK